MKLRAADIIIKKLSLKPNLSENEISSIFKKHINDKGKMCSKSEVLAHYKSKNTISLSSEAERNFLHNIKMKKTRTLSGVTTVTVLTKPFPCPGKCIFCPNDVKMPKSYIASEPGAQRAQANQFDPYAQTYNRLTALNKIGHNTDKVELIVLGGTWTSYTLDYQIWFIKRCFDAMNDFDPHSQNELHVVMADDKKYEFDEKPTDSGYVNYNLSVSTPPDKSEKATWDELKLAHKMNESAQSRCVGLSIETRPDEISEKQVKIIRKLGATKVQIGIQSLNDHVLRLNRRGHDSNQTAEAFSILRSAGFKIQAHYMPNLYGSTPDLDVKDFKKLFSNNKYRPDELKLYPCSLIDKTELMIYFKSGKWRPYEKDELLYVLSENLKSVPRYCRVTRVIRDIPSQEIITGNKLTNLRQMVENILGSNNEKVNEIRVREIKGDAVDPSALILKRTRYHTNTSTEIFLEYVTNKDNIAGFLRLSFPLNIGFMPELKDAAIIREVHVYGPSLQIGTENSAAQHSGLGKKLIAQSINLAKKAGFKRLAVISSIGTKKYYAKFGFKQKGLYQILDL